jgi:multidrug resistance protein, MATE family
MTGGWSGFRREIPPMVRLAAPLAMAELGWMAMGFVDTVMAGRIGAAALGAGSLGGMLFFPIATCGIGLLLGMDTLVSQAFGARDYSDCRRTLVQGLWLAAILSPAVIALLALTLPLLRVTGTNPHVLELLGPYLRALLWGVPPLLLYTAMRRYLQAMDIVKPITIAALAANLLNFAGNWVLMYGNLGAPRLGLEGSGISTSISRVFMALVLLGVIVRHERRAPVERSAWNWRPKWGVLKRLAALGFPVAMQIFAEGAVFALVTIMAARFDEVSLAAHSIAVNVISLTFMVPLGVSSAAAVRVGQAFGRRSAQGMAVAGWTALALGAGFMASAGIALATIPRFIARLYTPEAAVVLSSASLLRIAALFQTFDGLQVVATGAMRGLGNTRTPAIAHFTGYWILGLPVAYWLAFPAAWGVKGIWTGLTSALILIGIILLLAWRREVRRAAAGLG